MTRAQERALEQLKERFVGFYGYAEEKEIKECKVTEYGENGKADIIYVYMQVGYIGDEGTNQEVFCRNQLSVCIGVDGGYFKYSDSPSHYKKRYSSATLVCCNCQWR